MDGFDNILARRSIRVYTQEQVPDDVTEKLLRAGMAAPSAQNSQPWEFLVMREPEKKSAVSALGRYWGMLKSAPLGILVMANLSGYRASKHEFFIQDCSAATQNILLAAHALGLGGVWLGLYPKEELMRDVRDIYGIPEDIIPFSIVSLGYPAETKPPHDHYNEDKVHRDVY
jgi:nitroreductase